MSAKVKYKPEFAEIAFKLCSIFGAIDPDLAEFLGCVRDTVIEWRKDHPEFAKACETGKAIADSRVVKSLFVRANGYDREVEKPFMNKDGHGVVVKYTQHFPPDVMAQMYWLNNRDKINWRQRQEIAPEDGGPPELVVTIRSVLDKPREQKVIEACLTT